MVYDFDIAIIGGGAAGLAAAIFSADAARQAGLSVNIIVVDGANNLGAKLRISGGGRCNVTHQTVTAKDYNGPQNIIRNILRNFNEKQTVQWFASMGVQLKTEPTGKLFPTTDQSATVLNGLLDRCKKLKVKIKTDCRVKTITPLSPLPHESCEGFSVCVTHNQSELRCKRLIMATGGQSLPKTGSDGAGWSMVKKLGHTATAPHAALVPLILEDDFFHANITGLSQETQLSTFSNGKRIDQRTGSLLWTHFGISGPVVMDASRYWVIANANGDSVKLLANFLPGDDFASTENWLIDSTNKHPQQMIKKLIGQRMSQRMADALVQHIHIELDARLSQISRTQRRELVHTLTALSLPVTKQRGWNYAEVTAGGVPLQEINYRTMASRVVSGLYLIGEMLDVDGRIGGFNFQWAWSSGYSVGQAVVKDLHDEI